MLSINTFLSNKFQIPSLFKASSTLLESLFLLHRNLFSSFPYIDTLKIPFLPKTGMTYSDTALLSLILGSFWAISMLATLLGDVKGTTGHSGISLLNSASAHSFRCINDGSQTFLSRPDQAKSAIDLTFISSPFFFNVKWQVLEDSLTSDHFPTLSSIDCSYQKRPFFSCRLKWSDPVKKSFIEALSVNFHDLTSSLQNLSLSPNERLNIFTSFLLKLLPSHSNSKPINKNKNSIIASIKITHTRLLLSHPSSPPSNPPAHSFPKPPVPWWNEDCERALSERKPFII